MSVVIPGHGCKPRANVSYCIVMPGLVPGIHVFAWMDKDVDGRDKPGHDE